MTRRRKKNLAKTSPCKDLDEKLRVISWNAGGLTRPKFLEFRHMVMHNDSDVFFIFESGLATELEDDYQFNGYNMFILKRGRQIASGIIVGCKNSVTRKYKPLHEMTDNDLLEAVEIKIRKKKRCYTIVGVYNPPNNKPDLEVIASRLCPYTFLIGDFNSPSTRWGYQRTTSTGRILEDFIDDNMLDVIDTPPTFLSYAGYTSRPDLVIVHPNFTNRTKVALLDDAAGHGHRALLTALSLKTRKFQTRRAARWNFKKVDWDKYKKVSDDNISLNIIDKSNPEKTLKLFNNLILECALNTVPRGKVANHQPFWSPTLTQLKNERNAARRKAERTNSSRDLTVLRKKQEALHRNITASKTAAYRSYVEQLDFRKDGIKAHKFISRLNNDQAPKGIAPIVHGNRVLTEKADIANAFCSYYSYVSRIQPSKEVKKTLSKRPLCGCLTQDQQKYFNDFFTMPELDRALKSAKSNKAAGPDELYQEFLVNLGPKAKTTMLAICNLTWEKHVPDQWRKSEIIPLLKKGKPAENAESYRPISLTSSMCKLTERMVADRLVGYLEENKIIDDAQAGFRPRMNTMDQVVKFTQFVKDGFNMQMSTLAVLVDMKAAYDKVWRTMLLHKLSGAGVAGRLFNWIKSFLAQRQIRVKYEGEYSRYRQQRDGLPQGAVLSCVLFNVMINDILDAVREVPGVAALLYADDLLIWATSKSFEGLQLALNTALRKIELWADRNNMTVSTTKTVFKLFTLSTKPGTIRLQYKGAALEEQDIAKYLGISMDTKLQWKDQVEQAAVRGRKRMKLLKRLTTTKWGATQDVLSTAYKNYVRPSMEYGSEVFDTASKQALEKLDRAQNAALRLITGAAKSTPITAMELQTGIEPLGTRRQKQCLKFWERTKRVHNNFWRAYRASNPRLKTQTTPIQHAKNLAEKFNINIGDPAPRPAYADPNLNLPDAKLTLEDHGRRKKDCLDLELRAAALHTLHLLYPREEWLHIYTDGSSVPGTGRTGAGYFSHLFEGSVPIGTPSSSFDGELAAVKAATERLASNDVTHFKKVVFLIDSQAAILALSRNSDTDSQLTLDTRASLNSLCATWFVKLQWIPSHVGILGNEKADILAKHGTTLPQPSLLVPLSTAKSQIDLAVKSFTRRKHLADAHGKSWECLTRGPIVKLPRHEAVPKFRTLTGHDLLPVHLHRLGIVPSPECPLCRNGNLDGLHLLDCQGLAEERRRTMGEPATKRLGILYWSARHRMAEMPRVGVG